MKKTATIYPDFKTAREAVWRHGNTPIVDVTPVPLKEKDKKTVKKEVIDNG